MVQMFGLSARTLNCLFDRRNHLDALTDCYTQLTLTANIFKYAKQPAGQRSRSSLMRLSTCSREGLLPESVRKNTGSFSTSSLSLST